MNKEIYLMNMEWTHIHDNIGGLKGKFVFKDMISYDDYLKITHNKYFNLSEIIDEEEDESPYCSVCGHCGEIGCCGITNFLREHVEGKTNCLNEGEILGEIESICEYETKVFKDNEAYEEKIAVALAKIDELQQDIFGLEDKMWIYQDLDRIKEVLKHD